MPVRVGLAQDATDDLLDVGLGRAVRKRGEDIRERTVPALLQRVHRDDESDGTVLSEEVRLADLVLLRGLDRDLLRRDSHRDQLLLQLVERLGLCVGLGLRLKEDYRAHVGRDALRRVRTRAVLLGLFRLQFE